MSESQAIINEKIAAVIVCYHPELENLIKLITELNNQQVYCILVDNGSLKKTTIDELSQLALVISLPENVGIAKAQNLGIERAYLEYAPEFLLFFDQDSQVDTQFINNLIKDYYTASKNNLVAAIGPTFIDSRYGFYYPFIKLNTWGWRTKILPNAYNEPFEVSMIISSGSLIPVNVLKDVGNMNESLFIDYVDTEWCLRAIAKGYKVYVATSAKMYHSIGDNIIKLFYWNIVVHSAFRRYYRLRNGFYLTKMQHIPLLLKIRENIFNSIQQLLLVITQSNKKMHLKTWYRAIRDGVKSK